MKKLLLITLLIVGCEKSTAPQDCAGVIDIDGNCYTTVQIGDQLWMAENLKVTHYNNGDEIPTEYTNEEWVELITGAYAIYNNDSLNLYKYGNLYNWYAVDDIRGLCPEGWHVPTDDEWTELEIFVNTIFTTTDSITQTEVVIPTGYVLGSTEWGELYTNQTGFSALPSGHRTGIPQQGIFAKEGISAFFYTSTEIDSAEFISGVMSSDGEVFSRRLEDYFVIYKRGKKPGYSIRCLKD